VEFRQNAELQHSTTALLPVPEFEDEDDDEDENEAANAPTDNHNGR
jgi:hypothetical protein